MSHAKHAPLRARVVSKLITYLRLKRLTYLEFNYGNLIKSAIVEFMSKTIKIHAVEDWFLWHQRE